MNRPDETSHTESAERRRRSLLWAAGAVSAATLVLAVNGTLSAWTTAIIDNTHNDVAVTGAVALLETGPDGTTPCDTGTASTNEVGCTSINKYGGTGTALDPDSLTGNTQSVAVNLKNTGTVSGGLVLSADDCVPSAAAGSTGADPAGHSVCDVVTVAVSCDSPSTMTVTPVVLSSFTGGDVGTLAAGADTDCTFTLTLPADTPSAYASQVASQVLHWTLTAS